MYQKFTVEELRIHEEGNRIILGFTLDLDEDTVNDSTVYITETNKNQQPIIKTAIKAEGKQAILEYKDLKVNTDYEIHATRDIQSITEDTLDIEYIGSFHIESTVDSIVKIISPSDYEEVKELYVVLSEIAGQSEKLFNNFDIQIATDVRFDDVILETSIYDKNQYGVSSLKPAPRNQYYIRARATNNNDKGNWSPKITFTTKTNTKNSDDNNSTDEFPVFVSDLKLVGYPENGETPNSFILEFDQDIDPNSFDPDSFILIRKKV